MSIINIRKYKALIFDLFHTLVHFNHTGAPGKSMHEFFRLDKDQWHQVLFSESADRLKGRITSHVEIIRDFIRKVIPDVEEEVLLEASRIRAERFVHVLKNTPGNTIRTLKTLRDSGFKTALISNADHMEIAGWGRSPLASCFNEAVFSCEVGYMKPEEEIYRICLERLGLEAEECLFIGDGSCEELPGARGVGLDTVFTSEFLDEQYAERIAVQSRTAKYHITNINQLLPGGR